MINKIREILEFFGFIENFCIYLFMEFIYYSILIRLKIKLRNIID